MGRGYPPLQLTDQGPWGSGDLTVPRTKTQFCSVGAYKLKLTTSIVP